MAKPNAKAPLGQGGRFAALKQKLGKREGVTNPGALAAYIGRKKYGAKRFGAMSHMPAGASMTPSGDIAVRRQRESVAVGGFKDGSTYSSPFADSASGGVGGVKKAKDTTAPTRVVGKR